MAIDPRPNSIECPKWEPASPGAKRCKHYGGDSHACLLPEIGGECVEYTRLRKRQEASTSAPAHQGAQLMAGATVAPSGPTQTGFAGDLAPPPPKAGAGAGAAKQFGGAVGAVENVSSVGSDLARAIDRRLCTRTVEEPSATFVESSATPRAQPEAGGRGSGVPLHRIIQGAIELGLAPPPDFKPAKEIDPKSIEALEGAVDQIVMRSESMGGKEIVLVREVNKDDSRLQISFRDAATIRLLVDCFPGAQIVDVRRIGEEREIPF